VVEDASTDATFADNPFVTGDPHLRFYAGHPLAAPGGEHFGTLCILDTKPRTLDDRQLDLLRELAQWVQNELTEVQELDEASLVQRALYGARAPEVAGYTLAASATPAGQLMGDVYDWYIHEGLLRVTLADVMGKGAGAAIIAAEVRASLRTAPSRSLGEAVTEVDRLLEADIGGSNIFVTAVHTEIDIATGALSFVDAGHSLAFILRADGRWEYLESTGLPLGMGFDEVREPASARLEVGDSYLVCSDGLIDVLDPDDPYGHVYRVLTSLDPGGCRRRGRATRARRERTR
jgi:serine phosphatase RsbU (regulator of sigma subunit)